MARELDPMEIVLIEQAASDCLEAIRQYDAPAASRFVRIGNDTFRVRVSIVIDRLRTPIDTTASL